MKKIILLSVFSANLVLFTSCSKEEKPVTNQKEQEEPENSQDTILSPEEKFSSSILIDFLDDYDDDDLAAYLEDELFKKAQDYRGASVLQVSNNLWFVTLESRNQSKNFLLQKFVDFQTNDYYFVLNETSLKISDIITSANLFGSTSTIKKQENKTK